MAEHCIIIVTAEYLTDEGTRTTPQAWLTGDLDFPEGTEEAVIPARARWISAPWDADKGRLGNWSEPTKYLPNREVVDLGLIEADDLEQAKAIVEAGLKSGAKGEITASAGTKAAQVAGLPLEARWHAPEIMPTMPSASTESRPVTVLDDGTEVVARYLPDIGAKVTDHDFLRTCRDEGLFVLYSGPPGTGKTLSFKAAHGDELVYISGSEGITEEDLLGSWQPDPANPGQYVWVMGSFSRAFIDGLFFMGDEWNRVSPLVTTAIHDALVPGGELTIPARPDLGSFKRHPRFGFGAGINPESAGAVMDSAFEARFHVKIKSRSDWEIARIKGLDARLIAFCETANVAWDDRTLSKAPQLREAFYFQKVAEATSLLFAARNLISFFDQHDQDEAVRLAESIFGFKIGGPLSF